MVYPLVSSHQPVLVFGGAYSNRQATSAMLDRMRELGIPPERTICTGDMVAYCADPEDSVALIRGANLHVVSGNCEEQLAAGADDCGCGFSEGSTCDLLSVAWYRFSSARIDTATRLWMASLPPRIDLEMHDRSGAVTRLAIVHATLSSSSAFIFASSPERTVAAELEHSGSDGVIAGHCGLPFTRMVDGRLWHNTGAIGMPANDGTPRGWYSLIIPGDQGIEIQHHSLDFDQHQAADRMTEEGLPQGYAEALRTGLWPSLDVLPEPERLATGKPLRLGENHFQFRRRY